MSVRYFQADPHRNRGALRATFVVSFLLHAGIFAFLAFYRLPGSDQPVLAPFNMVELAEPSRGPRERARPQQPHAEPAPTRREPAEPPAPRSESKAPPRAPVRLPAKSPAKAALPPQPAPAPTPAPTPLREVLPTIARKPEDTPPPVRPKASEKPKAPAREVSEEELRERLKAIRERVGSGENGSSKPARETDVASSIERIRAKVGEPAPAKTPPGRSPPRAPALVGEAGVVDSTPTGSVIADMRFAAYRARLWSHVKAHWSLPPSLAGRGLSTVVVASVTRNGVVSDAKIEISSGVEAFDLMALRALLNSSPLPEVPADIPDSSLGDGLGFRFTESGAP